MKVLSERIRISREEFGRLNEDLQRIDATINDLNVRRNNVFTRLIELKAVINELEGIKAAEAQEQVVIEKEPDVPLQVEKEEGK